MDATISCKCHNCGHIFTVNAKFAGWRWPCTNCGNEAVVPNIEDGEHAQSAVDDLLGPVNAAPQQGAPTESILDDGELGDATESISIPELASGVLAANLQGQQSTTFPEAIAPEQTAPPSVGDGSEVNAEPTSDEGRVVAGLLANLLELADPEHWEENRALFSAAQLSDAPQEEQIWGRLALVTGIYATIGARGTINSSQTSALLRALQWANRYEAAMRPKQARQRLKQTLTFCASVLDRPGAREEVSVVLSSLVTAIPVSTLDLLEEEAASMGLYEIVREAQGVPRPVAELAPKGDVIAAPIQYIERLWGYLDRSYEAQNAQDFDKIRNEQDSAKGRHSLAKLGAPILRSMVYRCSKRPGDVDPNDLETAWLLAPFVVEASSGEFKVRAASSRLALAAIRDTRRARIDRDGTVKELTALAQSDPNIWNDIADTVTSILSQMSADTSAREATIDWLRILTTPGANLSSAKRGDMLVQAKRLAPESLLIGQLEANTIDADAQARDTHGTSFLRINELVEAYRRLDLPEISRILEASRTSLIAEVCRKLANSDPPFDSIVEPRRPLRLARGRPDSSKSDEFEVAKKLLASTDATERRRACDMFEEFARRKVHPDYRALHREWMLYAKAIVRGMPPVFEEWARDIASNTASWEEIWNLAVFHRRIGNLPAALNILVPGVASLRAPYAHLRFAVYVALQMVDTAATGKFDVAAAQRFLIDNIRLHPVPEAYLVWLLLADEAEVSVEPEDRVAVLAAFERLNEEPIHLPEPGSSPTNPVIDAFRGRLNELGLDRTWLIWINEYAERASWRSYGYRQLADALERSKIPGALDRAGEALQRGLEIDARNRNAEPRHIRSGLVRLFNFYKNSYLEEPRKRAFRRYFREAPFSQFWDVVDPANNTLVNLTRDLLEASGGAAVATQASPGGVDADPYILSALKRVASTEDLADIEDRVHAWIGSRIHGSNIVQQRADFVKAIVRDIARLHKVAWNPADLQQEIKRLNEELVRAAGHIAAMKELKPLLDVFEAAQKAYGTFTEGASSRPSLDIHVMAPGLAIDAGETSLLLEISNAGPGDVSNLKASIADTSSVAMTGKSIAINIAEGRRAVVSIPVITSAEEGRVPHATTSDVSLSWDWGVLEGLKTSATVTVPWYSFSSYLSERRPGAYEIPIPYTEEPIDFTKNDHRLFQGRESFVAQARSVVDGHLKTPPIYYHGVRKVGKSSLLSRIAFDLREAGVHTFLIKLEGIRASQQSLSVVTNTFTAKIAEAITAAGTTDEAIRAIAVDAPNQVLELISLFRRIADLFGDRKVALLIDEFQNLVGPDSAPLLDVLRQVYQEHRMFFFFSGWVRPKQLERACPETQLFPLAYHAIDFLDPEAVARVLREPLVDLGIEIPAATVDKALELTAGNPHHLAALAMASLARLNAERRVCISPQDLEIAAQRIVTDDRYFRSTIFSQMILTREERDSAVRFAQLLKDGPGSVPVSEATKQLPAERLEDLREKGILQSIPGQRLTVRGALLARYLQGRIAEEPPDPAVKTGLPTVGIFADIENLRDKVPRNLSWEDVGKALQSYAAQFGSVVCRWACFDRASFSDPAGVRFGLERANFDVSLPEVPRTAENAKDRADFVLIERIHDEQTHRAPQVIVITSGDHAYVPLVTSLLAKDTEVVIVSHSHKLSPDYMALKARDDQRRRIAGLEGSRLHIETDLAAVLGTGTAVREPAS